MCVILFNEILMIVWCVVLLNVGCDDVCDV